MDQLRRRRAAVLAISLALLAVPVQAAGRSEGDTWYVAPTGSGGGSCTTPHFQTIQAAVDASGRGDTVLVCPGVYAEWVRVRGGDDGVTIRSTKRWAATLDPPTASEDETGPRGLLTIQGVSDVRVIGMRFGHCGDGLESGFETVIDVRASAGVVLTGNNIHANGCTGIGIANAPRVMVARNVIRDFGDGIILWGPRTIATAKGNRLRCGHKGAPVIRCGLGFYVDYGARVRLIRNEIVGVTSADAAGRRVSRPLTGIQATADGLVLRGNSVRNAIQGIFVSGDGILVARNTVRRGRALGLWIEDSQGGEVRDNIVRWNRGRGLAVGGYGDSVSNLYIHDNDARGNGGTDCQDWTSGGGTVGTANTWHRNLGDDSKPSTLCRSLP